MLADFILPRMDWLSTYILAIAFSLALIAWIRTIPKRRFLTFAFLVLPVGVISMRWAAYRTSWTTWWIGGALALSIVFLWWVLHGRSLTTPKDEIQCVWTKDEPFE